MRTALILSLLAWASLSFAQLTTLQDFDLPSGGCQQSGDLETVARSLEQDQILIGCILLGPLLKADHG
jgi:hypothetical protein